MQLLSLATAGSFLAFFLFLAFFITVVFTNSRTKILKEDNDSKEVKHKNKTVILHVGPPKIGSTTIQTLLALFDGTGVLDKEKYLYVGENYLFRDQSFHPSIGTLLSPDCDKYVQMLHNESYNRDNEGGNYIISDEALTSNLANRNGTYYLSRAFIGYKINLTIGYRHFFDWLISYWHWQYRLSRLSDDYLWPLNNTRCRPAIDTAYAPIISVIEFYKKCWDLYHIKYTKTAVDFARNASYDFTVLSLHDTSISYGSNFFCNGIKSNNLCKASVYLDQYIPQSTQKRNVNLNGSILDSYYYYLANEAAKQHLFDPMKHSRRNTSYAVKNFNEITLKQTILDLPFICPGAKKLNDLYTLSKRFEMEYSPLPTNSSLHDEMFAAAKESYSFCELDTKKILSNQIWTDFFTTKL